MSRRAPWIVAGAAAVALAGVLSLTRPASGSTHPEPRPGITAANIFPDFALPRNPRAYQAYAAARKAAPTLDGVYCYCDCSKHSGHRSLLTCFETEHGAYCDVCMEEALTARQLNAQGKSLQEIRTAIDLQFGT